MLANASTLHAFVSKSIRVRLLFAAFAFFVCIFAGQNIHAQTTAFSYQGVLNQTGVPANGNFEMQFKLFDSVGGPTQIGPTLTRDPVTVTNGGFAVVLDFGSAAFPGPDRFLEIGVRPAGSPSQFTLLVPRHPLTSTPYAIRSSNAGTADSLVASCVGCVTAAQIGSSNVPAGSGNYIQNGTTPQSSANFNIGGVGVIGNRLGVGTPTPTLLVHVVGSQPAPIVGNGTNAVDAVGIYGGKGGNTDGMNATVGGRGASLLLQAGNGGDVVNGGGTSQGGEGGFIFLNPGSGGSGGNSETGKVFVSGKLSADSYEIDERRIVFGDVSNNTSIGFNAGQSISTGSDNTFLGVQSGGANSGGNRNTFIGSTAGQANATGNNNATLGYNANVNSGALSFATAIGSDAIVTTSNTILLGRSSGADAVSIRGDLTTATLTIQNVGGIPGITQLCVTAANLVKICSSSARYKNNILAYRSGLDLIRKLRPVSFNWKDGGMADMGLVAEDVEAVEPLLVTRNDKGGIEGVKYDRVGVVLINAVKEQQEQIDGLQKQISEQSEITKRQQTEIDALKAHICSQSPSSAFCKSRN